MLIGSGDTRPSAGPLDVLFVISGLGVGGSERQLALLASALARAGVAAAVYAIGDGPVRQELKRNGVEVLVGPGRPAGLSAVTKAAVDLFSVMRRRRPRMVHFFLPAAFMIGAPMALLAGVPVRIMSRRSLNTYQRHVFSRLGERCCLRTVHAALGNSRRVVAQLLEEGVPPARVGLIYNGVAGPNGDIARGEARTRLGLAPESLVMTIVANLIPYKGHADLIDALALARPHLPEGWRLLAVGRDDGIGTALKQRVRDLAMDEHVVFMGSRDDVGAILAASDVGILNSHQEGFSNAVLEGMAAGLPMIVTEVGGNAEAVIDGETGLVVPAHDSKALAAAIVRVAGDPDLRAAFGAAGRKRAGDEFGVDRFVHLHRAVYAALDGGRLPADVTGLVAVP